MNLQLVRYIDAGQTEQEHLATYLDNKRVFAKILQQDISFENIRTAANKVTNQMQEQQTVMHEEVITNWLSSLRQPASAI